MSARPFLDTVALLGEPRGIGLHGAPRAPHGVGEPGARPVAVSDSQAMVLEPERYLDLRTPPPEGAPSVLRFVRHGATAANIAKLRCGGDLDIPLTESGRVQAREAAQQLRRMDPPPGLIVTSDLKRTRETAAIIAQALGEVPVVVQADFAERRLGRWNLLPIAATQAWFEQRKTPPGGESDDEFVDRIARAVRTIKRQLPQRPLLVGSKGVARVMGELIGIPERLELDNGVVAEFDFTTRPCLQTTWSAL